jgi:DNA-binding transcriptional LysR family regulator
LAIPNNHIPWTDSTLLAFVRVVEAGSFTKAAQTLHMSKTTVSQLVQQLEARLQVKLLNRTTRQVKVTPEGAAYYERVARTGRSGRRRYRHHR